MRTKESSAKVLETGEGRASVVTEPVEMIYREI